MTADRELVWPGIGEGYLRTPDVYGERLGEERFIGRCPQAGCKARRTVDAVVFRVFENGTRRVMPLAHADGPDARWIAVEAAFYGGPHRASNNFMRIGLWCEEHRQPLKVRRVKARLVPAVKCASRCHNATSDTCDCECGGERHGEAWKLR